MRIEQDAEVSSCVVSYRSCSPWLIEHLPISFNSSSSDSQDGINYGTKDVAQLGQNVCDMELEADGTLEWTYARLNTKHQLWQEGIMRAYENTNVVLLQTYTTACYDQALDHLQD